MPRALSEARWRVRLTGGMLVLRYVALIDVAGWVREDYGWDELPYGYVEEEIQGLER